MRAYLAALLVAPLVAAAPAAAGVVLVSEHRGAGAPGEVEVMIEGDRLRMELPRGTMIWRGDRGVVWQVDPKNRRYFEISRETARGMAAQLDGAVTMLRRQMAKMPEQQRRQMEELMETRAPAPETRAETAYRKVASGVEVGPWRCDRWEKLVDGRKQQELCLAPLAALRLSRADLAPMREVAALAREMVDRLGTELAAQQIDPDALAAAAGEEVYPVRVVSFGERGTYEFELRAVERRALAPALFEPPAGYEKASLPAPGR
jgi:hypothetical protein